MNTDDFELKRPLPPWTKDRGLASVLEAWSEARGASVVMHEVIAGRDGVYADFPESLHPAVQAAMRGRGGVQAEYEDHLSGSSMNRPGLQQALALAKATHGVLVVAKLDRLSRSVADFAHLMEQARKLTSPVASPRAGAQKRVGRSPGAKPR